MNWPSKNVFQGFLIFTGIFQSEMCHLQAVMHMTLKEGLLVPPGVPRQSPRSSLSPPSQHRHLSPHSPFHLWPSPGTHAVPSLVPPTHRILAFIDVPPFTKRWGHFTPNFALKPSVSPGPLLALCIFVTLNVCLDPLVRWTFVHLEMLD